VKRYVLLPQRTADPLRLGVTVVDRRFRGFNVPVDQRAEFVGVSVFSAFLVLIADLGGKINHRNNDSDSAKHLPHRTDHLPVHNCLF
jgi:hypothetical protein